MGIRIALLAFFMVVLAAFNAAPAHAQWNNKPFSFKTPDGGVGMSTGGMQAIINQKVLGVTPENMVRGADGSLLDVTKGPGGSAFASVEGGGFIPGYKGSGWKGNNDISPGVFNAYYAPGHSNDSSSFDNTYDHVHAGAVISTWTTRVVTGQPVSFLPGNSVDMWTGSVSGLDN